MKFSQLLLLIIMINLLNVFIGLSIQSVNITDFEEKLVNWFEDSDEGILNQINTFSGIATKHNNWLVKFAGEVLQGLSNAMNTVVIMFQLVGLILWGWITPLHHTITSSMVEGITIIRIIGFLAILYMNWFNIMGIIKLVSFIKGAE